MEVPLRTSYIRTGWPKGLGQTDESGFEFDWDWISEGQPNNVTVLQMEGGYAGAPIGIKPVEASEGSWVIDPDTLEMVGPGTSLTIPYGQPNGQMTGPVPPLTASQLAQAITAGTVVLTKTLSGPAAVAGGACPSGYATPQGQCVAVQAVQGAKQILPGVSNQTLAIVGIGFAALILMGGKR
jgi:hypothetical protein